MNFNSAAEILTAIGQMQWASQTSQGNRAKINRLFNGDPPLTEDERKLNRLNTNFNWLEPLRIATNSRHQIYNAFHSAGDYFSVKLEVSKTVPLHKRDDWSLCMTQYINRGLRRSKMFKSALDQAHAQVVLHGPGPILWSKRNTPNPTTLGVDDVVVPAGTLADMSNLDYLAIYREWTWAQLRDMVKGPAVDRGWNKGYVDGLLRALFKLPLQPLYQGNRWLFPEKISEDMKENSAIWASSALGRVLAWDFYYRNETTGKWNRRILLDYNNFSPDTLRDQFQREQPQFLYEKDNYAQDWTEILHWFIGNCSNVAPFRYWSIRSIGYLLYGVGLENNNIRCRLSDHIKMSLLTWFRNVSDNDRERVEQIELHNMGIFPEGLSIVPAQERYTADYNLVGMGLNQNRQLMAESASAFLPDVAVEGDKPAMTATESLIRNNASVTLTSAVLNQLYDQAEPFYRETCRRFCIKDSNDPMCVALREEMKEDGIPLAVLNVDSWEITPNRTMGGGNKAVELTTARALFEARGAFGQPGDAPIKRKYALALTGDSDFAKEIAPDEPKISNSAVLAATAFGTLMTGSPFPMVPGTNEMDYIGTMIQLMAQQMQPLEALQSQPQGLSTMAEKIAGLVNVGQHIEGHIQVLAQDLGAKQEVNQFQRTIVQLMSQLKAYGQRLGEMEQAQQGASGQDAETQGKIIAMQTIAQAKGQVMQMTAQQKAQHKDAAFLGDQQRKDAETVAEIRRKDASTTADVAAKDLTTRAGLIHQARDHEQQMELGRQAAANEQP